MPHDDDVIQSGVGLQEISQPDQLFEYFAGAQVPDDAVESACAKDTTHAAANLRANTRGVSAAVLNEHTLDSLTVFEAQHQLCVPSAASA